MVKKFYASTTREALRQVRDALGANAIILSNRAVAGGIEIMAVADMDVAALTASEPAAAPLWQPAVMRAARAAAEQPIPEQVAQSRPIPPQPASAPAEASHASAIPVTDGMAQNIVKEIKFLRGMLEGQLAGLAWNDMQRRDPAKIDILRNMLGAGFSPSLSHQLLDRMPKGYDYDKGLRWVRAALVHNLHAVEAGGDIVERGGVYALVGPTGVGKTTTVAKLAARGTLKHGADKVALITTDSYRIGAHDQLRIYGRILGVPVYAIKDEADLQLTLADLRDKHLVLIDTVGMSQRDRRLAEQIALLCGGGKNVKRLLLISVTSQGSTLEDVVRSYRGAGLEGCILTKIDEALAVGGALDVIIRHRLDLHYVTNGQRVPEDMHLASPAYLVDRALKAARETTPFSLKDDDFPLFVAGMVSDGEGEGYSHAANHENGAYRG